MENSLIPTPKVATGFGTGAAVTILIWVLGKCGVEVPGEVGAAMVTVLGIVFSYLAPRSRPTAQQISEIPLAKLEQFHPGLGGQPPNPT